MQDRAPRSARPHGISLMVAVFALALSACTEVGGPAADDGSSVPLEIIVSEPALAFDGTANAAVASGVSYVSLPPGSLPLATSVRIRNRTAGGEPTSAIPVVDGGFDPVAIAADVGHELELTVTWATGGTRVLLARVPPRRPPSIVRTDPPKGRTDVALGVRPTVVFSEPIDPGSLSPTSLQLLQNGTAVPGSVALEPAATWSAVFTPASLLEPATTYELVVTRDIVDLNGDPLAETVRIPFTTTETTELSGRTGSIWGYVVDSSGVCLTKVTVEIVSGPGTGRQVLQTVPCDAWAYDNGFVFTNLPLGAAVTLRATSPGHKPQDRVVLVRNFGYADIIELLPE